MTILAAIGANALWLLYAWLASAIVATYLSEPQGLRREGRARAGPAAERRRRDHLAGHGRAPELEVEDDRAVRVAQGARSAERQPALRIARLSAAGRMRR